MDSALSTPATTESGWRRVNHCISTSILPMSVPRAAMPAAASRVECPPKPYLRCARSVSMPTIFSKYLSEYQPARMRSASSLNVSLVSRLPSKMLIGRAFRIYCYYDTNNTVLLNDCQYVRVLRPRPRSSASWNLAWVHGSLLLACAAGGTGHSPLGTPI